MKRHGFVFVLAVAIFFASANLVDAQITTTDTSVEFGTVAPGGDGYAEVLINNVGNSTVVVDIDPDDMIGENPGNSISHNYISTRPLSIAPKSSVALEILISVPFETIPDTYTGSIGFVTIYQENNRTLRSFFVLPSHITVKSTPVITPPVTPIPEFPMVSLPIASVIGLVFLLKRQRR